MRDDRPLKLIRRSKAPQARVAAMEALATSADARVAEAGKDLQSEFGKQHVALIVGCNQFVRFYRDGDHDGHIEVLVPADHPGEFGPALGGAVFSMFGWRSLPADDPKAHAAVEAAVARALATDKPKL